ncbi:ATP-dependent DNA helicase [Salinibacterium sp. ZJ77]|uniref:ATP-dependent helicase n=1 Tax=Salinibacterium sp. ZJ77 TaxID=2708337 RepID=UPI001421E4FB|nr:ATP-dependent DNA helicase [Salinibacterium sp. ZJ77]
MPARDPRIPFAPDASQQAVLDLPAEASALVVGAAGSGKTSTLVELVARRVLDDALRPEQVLVLAASRHQADALRERIAERVPIVTTGPWARTAASVAFEAVAERARLEGATPPRLLSGAEHDLVIRDVLEGHLADGSGPDWPAHLDQTVRGLASFRTELRELMMRATEYDIRPAHLVELGRRHARPAWMAAGEFMAEYEQIVAQSHAGLLDPAELTVFAAHALRDGVAGERLAGIRLVIVDDVQQSSEGTVRLVRAFADAGAAVVGFGDPDLAADTFRGAGAQTVARFRATALPADASELTLTRVHRHGPTLRGVVRTLSQMIGTAGVVGQREAAAGPEDAADVAPAVVIEQPSAWTLSASIGRELRERHLLGGVPWSELAVIVRSRGDIAALERHLATAQVPTRSSAVGRPLREHAEAAALLRVVEVAVGRAPLDGITAAELLTGPFGALDSVGLRRLRLAVRAEALTAGDARPSGDLLAEALQVAGGFASIDTAVGRQGARMSRVLARVAAAHAQGGSAEELLWEAWDGSGVAESWRRSALGTGIAAEEASRALDGVVALFAAARRFAESRPSSSVTEFLDELLDAEVPADIITPQTAEDAVLITTPTGAVGFEFDTVIVTGLQDGRWPDLRVRGTLLGGPALVEVATGLDPETLDARREVLGDELRLLTVAASRARRRLVLAVVSSDDEVPSPVVAVLRRDLPTHSVPASPLTLRGAVGRMRHTLTSDHPADRRRRDDAAAALALLAEAEIPGADPRDWRGLAPVSTDAPLVELDDPENPDVRVTVSPSRLETFARSAMEWFVEANRGGSAGLAAGFGTLIHDVLEHAVTPEQQTVEAMTEALRARWGELQFESAWVGVQQERAATSAIDALAAYLAARAAAGAERLGAETEFELDEAPARLRGKIDRIERQGDDVVIIDLKTGSPKSQKQVDENPQLKAYQLAFARGQIDGIPDGVDSGGARMLYTRGTATSPYKVVDQSELSPEQLADFAAFVRDAATVMAGTRFPATPIDDPYLMAGSDIRLVHLPGEVSGD